MNQHDHFDRLQEEAKQAARSLLSASGSAGFLLNLEEDPHGRVLIVARRDDVVTHLLTSAAPPPTTH